MGMDSNESFNAVTSSAKVAVLVLMGLPGSGKTTLGFSLPHFLGNKYHVIHICYDQVIPFKQVQFWEEEHGSWKDERASVVQASDTLICDLIGAHSPRNKKRCYRKEESHGENKLAQNINFSCFHEDSRSKNRSNENLSINESASDYTDRKLEEERHSNQNNVSSFSLESVVISDRGHYTMLKTLNDIVSICDDISDCDLESELFVLCIDDNFYYRSMRKEWWNLAAKYELPFCIVTLNCDVEECVRRVSQRLNSSTFDSPNVPEHVINKMAKHLELPNGDLCPWEKYSIVIESDSLNTFVNTGPNILSDRGLTLDRTSLESLNRIKELINASLLEPAKPLNKEAHSSGASSMTTSVVHKADLVLRKVVSRSDPTIRPQVNVKRKKILEGLRNGKLIISSDAMEEFDKYVATLIGLLD